MGGLEMRMCTSVAPASLSSRTILDDVVPRTIESSTTTTRLPFRTDLTGDSCKQNDHGLLIIKSCSLESCWQVRSYCLIRLHARTEELGLRGTAANRQS